MVRPHLLSIMQRIFWNVLFTAGLLVRSRDVNIGSLGRAIWEERAQETVETLVMKRQTDPSD